ncbi:MAG: winged helix-turn-helix domain-containing protein [Rhodothermaceae bacterium]
MLKYLITSEKRIKLLLKFFLNPSTTGYLRQLSSEFNESTNGIRVELNKLTEAQFLTSYKDGRNVVYRANEKHPLFDEVRSIILKSTGIDKVISNILDKIGDLKFAFLKGDYAAGIDSGLIELVIVGNNLNIEEIERVKLKTEKLISRKIAIIILTPQEYEELKEKFEKDPIFILAGELKNNLDGKHEA